MFIQPLVGSIIVPISGGVSSTWVAVLSFFIIMLFIGQLYVIALGYIDKKWQIRVHIVVIVLALLQLLVVNNWRDTIAILDFSKQYFVILNLSLIAFFPQLVLSTTSTLLQAWSEKTKQVYGYYSISNLGSIIGIIIYPILSELLVGIRVSEYIWRILFIILSILIILSITNAKERLTKVEWNKSFLYDFIKVSLWSMLVTDGLLIVSSEITKHVPPVPLLWSLPILAYFIAYMWQFKKPLNFNIVFKVVFSVVFVIISLFITANAFNNLGLSIIMLVISLFILTMIGVNNLYQLKPSAKLLPVFYLAINIGGSLATILQVFIVPHIFNFNLDLIIFSSIFLVVIFLIAINSFKNEFTSNIYFKTVAIAILSIVLIFIGKDAYQAEYMDSVKIVRNEYGTVYVKEYDTGYFINREIIHGDILHGIEVFSKEENEYLKFGAGYYHEGSGVGVALNSIDDGNREVGIIGLGLGGLARYCSPGDEFTYFEIDPKVELLARNEFDSLTSCPQVDVVIGDGRIEINKSDKKFNIIILDAFSDDAIPFHLLTVEALNSYLDKLDDDGLLVFHLSNLYFDLKPLVSNGLYNVDSKLSYVQVSSVDPLTEVNSKWIIYSRSEESLREAFPGYLPEAIRTYTYSSTWTDDKQNTIPLIFQNENVWNLDVNN